MESKLWFKKPAAEWIAGLPVGNGRLAAMILGYTDRERISLNHEWLWYGKFRNKDNENRSMYLKEVRELLLAGKYEEGGLLANKAFAGEGIGYGRNNRVDPYQPAGDLYFELDHNNIQNYYRELDLETATVKVAYDTDGTRITRETIANFACGLIILRIAAVNGLIGGTFWLSRTEDSDCELSFNGKDLTIWMDGSFTGGIDFRVEAAARTKGGKVSIDDGRKLIIQDAEEIIIFLNIGTSAKGELPSEECSRYPVPESDWDTLYRQHVEEYQKHYKKLAMSLTINQGEHVPTDERLDELRRGGEDASLPLLYFNFGRYLLCSSSNGELPPNLQGKWNEEISPPWESDYHSDINLEMCYWAAESGNLQELTNALFLFIERFVPHARKAAKDLYGCNGVYFPIQIDPWGRSTPESNGWAVWIGAAAWLAQHMWWHYEYGQDTGFLRERAYPFFKEVAAFYESYLIEDEDGVFQIVPSQSPENRFTGCGNLPVSICVSSTMDVQLATDVLMHAIKASELLGVDEEKRTVWKDIVRRLPKMKIGSKGQLLEWNEEFEEVELGHRHLSHLFGLYPGDLITPEKTPELFEGARVSLERRLAGDGGHTGWSRSWVACCYARMGDAEKAWEHLNHLVRDFTTDSLLCLCPQKIFQIDGNLGGTAAVIEMLIQSYNEELHFLPALPKAWPSGKVVGLRDRGGYTVNMEWEAGNLVCAEVTPLKDRVCTVKYLDRRYKVQDGNGNMVDINWDGHYMNFNVFVKKTYYIVLTV